MNNSISTNDDLIQLGEELARLQILQTTRVLVAVSDFALKRLLQSFFQQRKYRSYLVFEKGSALMQNLSASKERALVIYDLEMADKNGLELLAFARKAGEPMKNATILMVVAGNLVHQAKEKLVAAGVNGILARPVSQEALVDALKDIKFPT